MPRPWINQIENIDCWSDLVLLMSDEGDMVLDPFMGSGTTAFVSQALGRDFLGFEISEAYCTLARARLVGDI